MKSILSKFNYIEPLVPVFLDVSQNWETHSLELRKMQDCHLGRRISDLTECVFTWHNYNKYIFKLFLHFVIIKPYMLMVEWLKNTEYKKMYKWFILTVSGLVQYSQSVVQRPSGGPWDSFRRFTEAEFF